MAGTINLSLSQQFDRLGKPLSGGKLYFFQAGTTTPQIAYKDTALTNPHPPFITLDAAGRVAEFWLADGSIKFRLDDKSGVAQIQSESTLVLGPSSGSGGGGGGAVDQTAIFTTGMVDWQDIAGTRDGWVRNNGRTIGSASAGSSERANADCQALFLWGWARGWTVVGGAGLSAAADWAANKQITLPDHRDKAPFGLDDMGNSAAGGFAGVTFTTGNATTAGSIGGKSAKTLSIAELPTITPAGVVSKITRVVTSGTDPLTPVTTNDGAGASHTVPDANQLNVSTPTQTFTGTPFGGGTSFDTMNPFVLGTSYRKL